MFFFVLAAVDRFRVHGRPQFIQQSFLKMVGSVWCPSMSIHLCWCRVVLSVVWSVTGAAPVLSVVLCVVLCAAIITKLKLSNVSASNATILNCKLNEG